MMTKEEYIKKMKELGWPDEYIQDKLQLREEAKKDGVNLPYEMDLFKAPEEDIEL